MEEKQLFKYIDHTLLKQDAKWIQINDLCSEAIENKTASVCIPPSFVAQAADFAKGRIPICTVIGFPNGYSTTAAKVFETKEAIQNGANEIDMVINIGQLKDGLYDDILQEINDVKAACDGRILKVIIETSMLTKDEKILMCQIVSRSGADYIKTSTGFGGGGATLEDIKLFKENIFGGTKIKAAGGIKSIEDAKAFVEAGADRLGTSSLLAMLLGR